MKKAFTLVELLVVIGILAILIGVLSITFGRGTEAARNAKCLTNMKNLANAVNSYVMAHDRFPVAGSVESYGLKTTYGKTKRVFYEDPGWISWYSQQAYRNGPTAHTSSGGWFISAYEQQYEPREYCLTNGAVWKYVSGNREVFVCPCHHRDMAHDMKPAWSYVMNGWYRFDNTRGSGSKPDDWFRWSENVSRHDRRLLFAEMQWVKNAVKGVEPVISGGTGIDCDPTLQYGEKDGKECIGFNHKDGKDWVAHVIFTDGHVEKLRQPKMGLSKEDVWELTKWLCEAKDVSFNGKQYEEMK